MHVSRQQDSGLKPSTRPSQALIGARMIPLVHPQPISSASPCQLIAPRTIDIAISQVEKSGPRRGSPDSPDASIDFQFRLSTKPLSQPRASPGWLLAALWQARALRQPLEPLPHRRAYASPLLPNLSQLVRPLSPVQLRWLLDRLVPLFAVKPPPHRRVYAGLMLQRTLHFVHQLSPVQNLSALKSPSNF